MSQRKKTLYFMGLLPILVFASVYLISGYSDIKSAETEFTEKNYTVASDFYSQAAKKFFWQNGLWEKAGLASAQAGEYQKAISLLEKSSGLSEEGWAWLGTSYFQLGDVDKAISTFKSGLQKYPSATLYRLLASVHRSQKDWDAEQAALENQLALDSGDAYAYYRLGLLLTLSSPEQAIDELTRASTLNLEVDSAAQTLISALNISATQSDDSEKNVTVGRALGLVQEWDLAFVAFEEAIQLNSQNAEAWAWLGEAKQQLGQDGSVELNQAVDLNRTSSNVRA